MSESCYVCLFGSIDLSEGIFFLIWQVRDGLSYNGIWLIFLMWLKFISSKIGSNSLIKFFKVTWVLKNVNYIIASWYF